MAIVQMSETIKYNKRGKISFSGFCFWLAGAKTGEGEQKKIVKRNGERKMNSKNSTRNH